MKFAGSASEGGIWAGHMAYGHGRVEAHSPLDV